MFQLLLLLGKYAYGTIQTMKQTLIIASIFALLSVGCEQPSQDNAVVDDKAAPVEFVTPVTPETAPAFPSVTRGAEISLELAERDFGTIWDYESVTTTFPFTNTGSKTLVLSRLKAGCGCTTPVADKTILKPGERGTITVTFDPRGKAGKQDKKVTIFSNSVKDPEKAFWIRSFVRSFVDVKNRFLKLNTMTMGEPHSVEFDFVPIDPNFTITSMTGTGKHGQYVSGTELQVTKGAPRRIRIDVNPNMPWGAFHSLLQVSGYGFTPEGERIEHKFAVFANGKTFGKIQADKHIISLGSPKRGGSYNKSTRIYRMDGVPFKVLNAVILQPNVAGMNATAVANIDGSYEIIISGTLPPDRSGQISGELMVQTDLPGEDVLKFRITGVVATPK